MISYSVVLVVLESIIRNSFRVYLHIYHRPEVHITDLSTVSETKIMLNKQPKYFQPIYSVEYPY